MAHGSTTAQLQDPEINCYMRILCFLIVFSQFVAPFIMAQESQSGKPSPSVSSNVEERLITDVKLANGDKNKAIEACNTATQLKNSDVLEAGLASPDIDVRILSLRGLRTLDSNLEKRILLTALKKPSLWQQIVFSKGEDAAIQNTFIREFAGSLKRHGVDTEASSLLQEAKRDQLVKQLSNL